MKIIGFNIVKISIERKEELENKLEIKQNINLEEFIKFKAPNSNEEFAKIGFTFRIDYSNSANVDIKGHIIMLPEKDEFKNILKLQKDKKVPAELKISLINFIMDRCNLKALNLENDLGLPSHIPLPKINPKKE
jgi:hypothetical protein